MANITIREYHPESGALLGNVSVLDFGKITAGTTSQVKVIDIAFSEVSYVGNIKLGIISNGGINVNPEPSDFAEDGTTGSGYFGIETSSSFISSKTVNPLSRHFAGINTNGSSENTYNVLVGNKNNTTSNYIYLDIEVGSNNVSEGNGAYKIFFDYS